MTELDKYRRQIDEIDSKIRELFNERMALMPLIGAYKRSHALPVEDTERESLMIERRAKDDHRYAVLQHTIMQLSKEFQRSLFNIYLIGMPYSGKSTVMSELALRMSKECIDTDKIIEKQSGMSIGEIFETDGEELFREAESQLLSLLAQEGSLVVATGGGIINSDDNIRLMKASGYTVLCDRPLDSISKAFEADKERSRPLVQSVEEIEVLYFERFKRYRETADLIVNPERSDAIEAILRFMNEKGLL